ncbi:MAG: hypothetical protein KDE04_18530 [Anaerolineales bacterium]|nr:hypothetical protein [Anaerolineales bacterium]
MKQTTPTASWYQRAAVYVGIGINPASISLGGSLARILPWRPLLLVFLVGTGLLFGLILGQGLASRRRQAPLAQRAADTFGSRYGAPLLNLMMAVGMVGWGGFHVGVSGAGIAGLLRALGLSWPGWVGTLLMITAVLVLSLLGITRWNALLWVTTSAALALSVFTLVAVDASLVFPEPAGPIALADYFWAIGTVIAYAILFSLRSADFSWDLSHDADVVKAAGLFAVTLMTAMIVGAILFNTTGDWNLAGILANVRLAALGQTFLVVAVLSAALSSLHSGQLALSSLTRLPQRVSLIAMSIVIFVLAAYRFDLQLLAFLDVVSALLPPSLVVMLVLPWFEAWEPDKERRHNVALWAWLLGAGAALVFKLQGELAHVLVGALVSLAVLGWGLRLWRPKPEVSGGGPAG